MKKTTLYSFLMILVFFSCQQEAEKKPYTTGQLTISNEHPQPGETLELTYKSQQDVDAFYAYMVGNNNYPVDIDFTEQDDEQKSSIKIPDSAVALAFIIKVDDTFDDNNKKGYIIPLYTKEGKPVAGSQSATAYYPLRYGEDYGIIGNENAAINSIKADLDANPDLKTDWQIPYLQLIYEIDKESAKTQADNFANFLKNTPKATEKNYNALIQFYNMMGDKAKADSLERVTLNKFPQGITANYEMVDAFQKEGDLDKKAELFSTYSQNNSKLGMMGNYMAGNLATTYYEQNDTDNFEKYIGMIDKAGQASIYNNLAWPWAEKGENLDQAEKMSKKSLDLITSLEDSETDKPDYYSKNQYKKNLKAYYDMYADTYALILFKQGKIKDAIAYQKESMDPKGKNTEANARYIEFLMADEQFENVKENAEQYIKAGNSTEQIKEAYKTAYLKVNPNSKDSEKKLKALNEEAYQNQVSDIKKTMLDEEAPAFTVKDTEGKDISLESLKGKTVILDFWATWCGPCKASFPGMQEVVTKYKDDDSVVLLFVDTFEKGKDREKMVEDFIKNNKYTFHVVYDAVIPDSNDFEVAKKYNISGIPTKVIIGPDGKMKFKSVGYNGSNEKLIQEMDIMIDILKS